MSEDCLIVAIAAIYRVARGLSEDKTHKKVKILVLSRFSVLVISCSSSPKRFVV